jgi:hypothetical protein
MPKTPVGVVPFLLTFSSGARSSPDLRDEVTAEDPPPAGAAARVTMRGDTRITKVENETSDDE